MRAFLAVPVLDPALSEHQALLAQLRSGLDEVRWAPADSPHITLHFFGHLPADRVHPALSAAGRACATCPPLSLCMDGLGSFPSGGHPRVLWWGVGGEVGRLSALARACAAALADAGFPIDGRPYRPHCTLGRPRDGWPQRCSRAWAEIRATGPSTSVFAADTVLLYESVSTSAGVRHVPRARLPLGTRPAQ